MLHLAPDSSENVFVLVATRSTQESSSAISSSISSGLVTVVTTTSTVRKHKFINETSTESSNDELSWPEFDLTDDELTQELARENITARFEDTHRYYNSTVQQNTNLTSLHWTSIQRNCSNLTTSVRLSNAYLRSKPVDLPFEFPFYGHPISRILITVGGFLYTGDTSHKKILSNQYISPLMAPFDTTLSFNSFIRHCETGEMVSTDAHKTINSTICSQKTPSTFHGNAC